VPCCLAAFMSATNTLLGTFHFAPFPLASPDISKPFRVSFADDERTLHVVDTPVAWKLLDIRSDEADRPQLDANAENPPVRPGPCSLHLKVEHTPRLRQSDRRRAGASLPSVLCRATRARYSHLIGEWDSDVGPKPAS